MEPAINIYIGAPVSIGSEAKALRRLRDDLQRAGLPAVLLVNLHVAGRQIDCVVITDNQAVLLDFKNLHGPIRGQINGPWYLRDNGGTERRYEGENPYQQVLNAKLALGDALKNFHKSTGVGIAPDKRQFFRLLNAAVCIWPEIAPGSAVTKGDFKCRIWGYPEALSEITTKTINPRWSMKDWVQFAECLDLEHVSFEAAISPEFGEAERMLVSYSQSLQGWLLSEMFPDLPGSTISLPEDHHALLVGPSGIGKTSRLKREAASLANSGRLVLFCSGRHYTGHLDRLLTRSVAPFSKASAVQLMEAAVKCGWSMDLIIDGIDGPDVNRQQDLTQGLAAFALRFGARVIISSMTSISLPPGIEGTTVTMTLLTDEQKLAIFKFHAAPNCVTHSGFLDAFDTAHDIMVAAHSVSSVQPSASRADYYAAYVLESLPRESRIGAGQLLRHVAGHMHQNLVRTLEFPEFERVSTDFLSSIGASLRIADDVANLPQVSVSGGVFSFKHDLWQDYLAAESLLSTGRSPAGLCEELAKPINQRIAPHVLGRIRDASILAAVLETDRGSCCVADGFTGGLGANVKAILEKRLLQVWEDLIIDAGELQVLVAEAQSSSDGKNILGWPEISGKRMWSPLERSLAVWISTKLQEPDIGDRFIRLLVISSCSLWNACETAARSNGLSTRSIFGSTLHVLFHLSGKSMPPTAFEMFRWWEQGRWSRTKHKNSTIELKERLHQQLENCPEPAKGPILFCLSAVLRNEDQADLGLVAKVFHMGWNQPLRPARMEMLRLIEWYGNDLVKEEKVSAESIRQSLEAALGDNPISNTFIFDALNVLDAVPPPVTPEDARLELQRIIGDAPEDQEYILKYCDLAMATSGKVHSVEEIRCNLAHSFVSKFWEDILQGVYWEIYEPLDQEEKVKLMNLAAMHDDLSFGDTFALEELIRFGHPSSAKVFLFHAELPRIDQPMQQDAVAAWCLGVIGCACLGLSLPEWRGDEGVALSAWKLIGELLYMDYLGVPSAEDFEDAWLTLRSEAVMGAADALLFLLDAERGGLGSRVKDHKGWTRLLGHQSHIRHIMEHSLLHVEKLVSLSKWDRRSILTAFIVQVLGNVGDQSSVVLLRRFVDDPVLGADAVAAIEKINKI